MHATPQAYSRLAEAAEADAQQPPCSSGGGGAPSAPDASDARDADAGDDHSLVHLFPEGGLTNGRAMLRFSRGFMRFADGAPVVPAAVRAHTWGLSTHTLLSSFAGNWFWFCFVPQVRVCV